MIKVVTSHCKLPYNSNYPDYVNVMAINTNTKQGKKKLYSIASVHAKSWP